MTLIRFWICFELLNLDDPNDFLDIKKGMGVTAYILNDAIEIIKVTRLKDHFPKFQMSL